MRSSFLRAITATTALVSAMAGGAALADCQPDPAGNGLAVTCSLLDANGFDAGAAANLTFNVLTGATVTTAANASTVTLNGGNVVNNAGTIAQSVGPNAGILLQGASNTVTNVASIFSSAPAGVGILALANANAITNLGTITASGTGGSAIVAVGDANVIANFGTITGDIDGILALGAGSIVTNAGSITVTGTASNGITVFDNFNTVANSGTIAASGPNAFGIWLVPASFSTITNSGTIVANGTDGPSGIALYGTNSSRVVNSGTIIASGFPSVAAGPASGILLFSGTNNTVINSGAIRATGPDAVAVAFNLGSTANAFINAPDGVIFADAAVGAVATGSVNAPGGTGALENFGTIDGRLTASATGLLVVNNGLIQITTGPLGLAHTVGSFTQAAGGTLALRVNPAAGNDRMGIAAAAVLGGTLRAVLQPGLYGNVTFYPNVVTAPAGLGGTQFASAVSSSPFFTASAAYLPTAVNLTLTRIGFGALTGLTQNQRSIGNGFEAAYSTAATGNAAAIFVTLLTSTTAPRYDLLSGEVGTGVQSPTLAMGDAFLGSILGQTQRWRDGLGGGAGAQSADAGTRVQLAAVPPGDALSRSYAQGAAPSGAAPAGALPSSAGPRPAGPRWAAWASGFGLDGERDGDGAVGSARLGYAMGGAAFGADVQLTPSLLLGGAVSGAGSSFSLDGRPASGRASTVFFGLYGSWAMGPLYVDAAASYGLARFSTTRVATLGTINEQATQDFDGRQVGGRVEAGWRFMVQRYALTPFAGVTVQSLHQDAYSETSSNLVTGLPGILGLSYRSETTTSLRTTLGAQAATTFRLDDRMTVTPRVRAAWAHEFNDDRQVGASFLTIPGASFTVNGARPARDAALVSAGVDLGVARSVRLFAQFDSELSGSGNAYAGTGGLRVSW